MALLGRELGKDLQKKKFGRGKVEGREGYAVRTPKDDAQTKLYIYNPPMGDKCIRKWSRPRTLKTHC